MFGMLNATLQSMSSNSPATSLGVVLMSACAASHGKQVSMHNLQLRKEKRTRSCPTKTKLIIASDQPPSQIVTVESKSRHLSRSGKSHRDPVEEDCGVRLHPVGKYIEASSARRLEVFGGMGLAQLKKIRSWHV